MSQIDFLLFGFWNKFSKGMSALAHWTGKMALAHYVAGKFQRRFSMKKLDTNLFIVVARRNEDGGPMVSAVCLVEADLERVKKKFEQENNVQIIFFKDLASFRHETVVSLSDQYAIHSV